LSVCAALWLASCAVLDRSGPGWRAYSDRALAGAPDLHVEERGHGRPILLLHGFGNSTYVWRHVAGALAGSCRVIAIDLKGFGRSPKPLDDRYSVYDQAVLIRDLILVHDLREVTIIGHSYGGGVALATAVFLQQRAPGRVAQLGLIDSIAYPQELPFFIRVLATPILGPVATRVLPARWQVRFALNQVYYDRDRIPESAVWVYATNLESAQGRHAAVQAARQILPGDLDALAAEYATLAVPALLVWGRHDRLVPLEIGKRLSAQLPQAQLRLIEDSGHSPAEEQPAKLTPLLQEFTGCAPA
jgi:pimeloyl-ACP methyl ester carboxylesterase